MRQIRWRSLEHAGGAASDGTQRILDVKPTSIHQRVPLIIGSAEDVEQAVSFMHGKE